MKFKLYTVDGKESSERDIPHFPSFEGEEGVSALRQVILAIQANRRQGNASTKTRAEVSGTGRKPFRQKGTGIARQGTRRAPQHYKGGVAFGPKPRDYSQKINRKMKQLAFRRALFERARDGEIDLIEKWDVEQPKTRLIHELINRIAPSGNVLIVDDSFNDQTVLAARNLPRITMTQADTLNSWDLVRYDRIIVSEKGIDTVVTRSQGGDRS